MNNTEWQQHIHDITTDDEAIMICPRCDQMYSQTADFLCPMCVMEKENKGETNGLFKF